jgi:hypothetical protein
LPDDTPLERPDDPKDTAKLKAVLVLVATVAFVMSPLFTDPFTGFDPDRMPVRVDDPPIQPAGYAFSIWGVIYLWLLASAGYGLLRRDTDAGWDATRWPLFVSLAIGASWIPVALVAPAASTVLIWVMLAGALWALRAAPDRDRPWLAMPIGLYAGWLTAASCVALATVAAGYGFGPSGLLSWAGLALALALAVAVAMRDVPATYPLAVAWALAGIVVANVAVAWVFAAVAAVGALAMIWLTVSATRARI